MLKNLGQRIRTLRKTKRITLIDISKKTGIAQATLSRIETGSMMGTVESHEKIAEVLGIGLSELYSGVDRRYDEIAHSRPEERKATPHSKNVEIQLLTQESSKKKITPLLLTLHAAGATQNEHQERGVEKFVYVLDGEVKVKVDKEEFHLKPGETLYFDASLNHQITNEKQKTARLLVAVSPSKI
ncbi:MAG: helix-turn-helix transcriptional regulator [Candidatus Omnitrophica bacterium]|nr:helix-turn-helix transcriptional regulator [Candidatus Omnitrophota bacterium]